MVGDKMKEYLVKNIYGEYKLTDHHSGFSVEDLIEVPEGAEEYRTNYKFYKNNGELFYSSYDEWVESGLAEYITLWKRDTTKRENKNKVSLGSNKKESEEVKEYLDTNYELRSVKQTSGYNHVPSGRIEVPEGAEIFLLDESFCEDTLYFVKHDGEVFHEYYTNATDVSNNAWIKGTIKELHKDMGKVLWQRNPETPNTSIQEKLKSIKKNGEVKMKEFLNPEQGYSLVECFVGETPIPSGWIEVPEGADEYRANYKFYKNNGELFYSSLLFEWTKSSMPEYITLWKRNQTTLVSGNTVTQEKLKFIEKWLNGEKIQYILGIESDKIQSEKTQSDKYRWHNFTECAMRYIKRSDIKFREAPKYVTINGIEFKSVDSLLKHVKNNFDLEDGELE